MVGREKVPAMSRARVLDVVDVAVYIAVLGLAVRFVPSVISEGPALTVLTALLLKGVLDVVLTLKRPIRRQFQEATTPLGRATAVLLLWLLAVSSKVVVLELTAFVFGDAVHLGGFFAVTGLVIVLLLARAVVRRLLGPWAMATTAT